MSLIAMEGSYYVEVMEMGPDRRVVVLSLPDSVTPLKEEATARAVREIDARRTLGQPFRVTVWKVVGLDADGTPDCHSDWWLEHRSAYLDRKLSRQLREDRTNAADVLPVAWAPRPALTKAEYAVLRVLAENPARAFATDELISATDLSRGTVAKAARRLIDLGLAVRPDGSLRKGISITAAGLELIDTVSINSMK